MNMIDIYTNQNERLKRLYFNNPAVNYNEILHNRVLNLQRKILNKRDRIHRLELLYIGGINHG